VLGRDAIDEFRSGSGSGSLALIWLWWLRTVVLVVVLIVVGLNLWDLFATPETGYYIVPSPLR
jgi:NSS family neurotransmitter:Na+ symporter